MESHHASLGRRTLEEIRQKRAVERLSKTSSGPDLTKQPPIPSDSVGIKKSTSGIGISELQNDISGLVSQLQELQKRNAELDQANRELSSKLNTKEAENEMLQKRVDDLERNTVPLLRRALKDVAMEKDAAVVAREDLSAQLRTIKKRLKEAEDEQYRAEEDATSLRAELNSLQQQAMNGSLGLITSLANSPNHIEATVANLKSQLEKESALRLQEQKRLAEEKIQTSALVSEKQELEAMLAAMSKRAAEEVSEKPAQNAITIEDKDRLEKQLHDMAVVVERLESSRQKLLMEIDSQSSEIERLFEENSNLSSAYQEMASVAIQWENQVKDCLKQNEELRVVLDKLRKEQASLPDSNGRAIYSGSLGSNKVGGSETVPNAYDSEALFLKGELAKEQSRAETLYAEVLRLSAQLQQATQAYQGLTRLYKPVLRNIENKLLKMKQEDPLNVQ